jgi:hypothetical protein
MRYELTLAIAIRNAPTSGAAHGIGGPIDVQAKMNNPNLYSVAII